MTRATRIATIDIWVESFYVFVGVYTCRFPHGPPGLIKYDFTILYLATWGHKWRFYDENVTFLPQTPTITTPLERSICNFGSALRATLSPRYLQQTLASRSGPTRRIPKTFVSLIIKAATARAIKEAR